MFKRIFLLINYFLFIQISVFSQVKPDIKGFNQSVFEYHFSRADRRLNPDEWLKEAKWGIEAAINEWELFSVDLYNNPFLFEESKGKIIEWSNQELENRFTKWLNNRFFGLLNEESIENLSIKLSNSHKRYLYNLDSDGNIIKENNNLYSVIRPGDDGHDYFLDLKKWNNEAEEVSKNEKELFKEKLSYYYPELSAFIQNSEYSNIKLSDFIHNNTDIIKTEFEQIINREERVFINRRTGDIWSLRKRSENESAANFVNNLILETEDSCNKKISELNNFIESVSADTDNISIVGEEWLELYKRQFEYGLKLWQEAEERFFIRRLEWENDSMEIYKNSQDIWLQAYVKFEEERQNWELKIKELFESGEEVFKNASNNLKKAINDAKIEFNYNLQIRTDAGTSKIKSYIDIYTIYINNMNIAEENIVLFLNKNDIINNQEYIYNNTDELFYNERMDFWKKSIIEYQNLKFKDHLSKLTVNERLYLTFHPMEYAKYRSDFIESLYNLKDENKILFIMEDIIAGKYSLSDEQNFIQEIKNEKFINVDSYNLISEKNKYFQIYRSYHIKAEEIKNNIMSEFSSLFETGLLNDIISGNTDNLFLDEYQLALIKAKSVAQYWERQIEIEKAVLNYAEEFHSGRMTEAEGIRAWENAKANYENAIILYEGELNKLNLQNSDIIHQQEKLNSIIANLNEIENEINYYNTLYKSVISSAIENRYNFLLKEIKSEYLKYLKKDEKFNSIITEEIYSDYVTNLIKLCNTYSYEYINEYYNLFINGDDENLLSFENLINKYEKIPDILNISELSQDINLLNFIEDNSIYQLIKLLINEKRELLDNKPEDERDILQIENQYNFLISEFCQIYKLNTETDIQLRKAAILLFDNTVIDNNETNNLELNWYITAKNIESLNFNYNSDSILEQLLTDIKYYKNKLLLKRLNLEIDALDYLLNGNDKISDESKILSQYCVFDDETCELGLLTLKYIRENFESDNYFSDDAAINGLIEWFISGRSYFAYNEIFIKNELKDYNISIGLFDLYSNFYTNSCFANQIISKQFINGLNNLCSNYNIESSDKILPNIENICDKILLLSGDFFVNAAQFLYDLDQLISILPEPIKDEFFNWKNLLVNYISIFTIKEQITTELNFDNLEIEKSSILDRYDSFEEIFDIIPNIDERLLYNLNSIYLDINKDELLLSYKYLIYENYNEMLSNNDKFNSNEKIYWYQFIDTDFKIKNELPDNISSWIDGELYNISNQINISNSLINDALVLYNIQNFNLLNESQAELLNLLNSSKFKLYNDNLNDLFNELKNIGNGLNYSVLDSNQLMEEKNRIETLLSNKNSLYENRKNDFLYASDDYYNSGINYDMQYAIVKNSFNELENYRFQLEIQDAIRRWASTSYLDNNINELNNCLENYERANNILSILTNLNKNEQAFNADEYNKLFNEYEQSYSRMLRIYKVYDTLNASIKIEKRNNNLIYYNLQTSMDNFYSIGKMKKDYASPEEFKDWKINDIITVKDGILEFAIDSSFKIERHNEENLKKLYDYFNITYNDGFHESTKFESGIVNLACRMNNCFIDKSRIEVWGLARNYLIRKLKNNNKDISFLSNDPMYAKLLRKNQLPGDLKYIYSPLKPKEAVYTLNSDYQSKLIKKEEDAWNKLSETERADLEFYLILTISGDSDKYFNDFSQYSAFYEYNNAYKTVYKYYKEAKDLTEHWWNIKGWFYHEQLDTDKFIADKLKIALNNSEKLINTFENGLLKNLSDLSGYKKEYENSCKLINELNCKNSDNSIINWDDIEKSLLLTNKFNLNDIDLLKNDWLEMINKNKESFYTITDAIFRLAQWGEQSISDKKLLYDNYFNFEYKEKLKKINEYYDITDSYVLGNKNLDDIENIVNECFNNDIITLKNYFKNDWNVLLGNLNVLSDYKQYQLSELPKLGSSIATLYSDITINKYKSELNSRQSEWDIQLLDLDNKHQEWKNTISSIIELGRNDWNNSFDKLQESYNHWLQNFNYEFEQTSDSWTNAYLSGLIDKENWLNQIETAAKNASSEALINLIGTDAERLSRVMDTISPNSLITNNAYEEAQKILDELLYSGNYVYNNQFDYLNSFSSISNIRIKQNNNSRIWDNNIIKVTAYNLANELNEKIAISEIKKMAEYYQNSLDEAIMNITLQINDSNDSFRRSMDKIFIQDGLWQKSGNNYKKQIIVNSTFFDPVITETKYVKGYIDFKSEPIELKTNLNNYNLSNLDFYAISNLMENANDEIDNIVDEIFGTNQKKETFKSSFEVLRMEYIPQVNTSNENKYNNILNKGSNNSTNFSDIKFIIETIEYSERVLNPGKFGAHIGYDPALKPIKGEVEKRKDVFYDEGSGELGRLLSDYFYWSIIENTGSGKLSMASWDKPLWDDRDSFFDAPSLRSSINMMNSVAVGIASIVAAPYTGGTSIMGFAALMAAVNTADDLVFESLDYLYKYKTIDEALFSLGKISTINLVSSLSSCVFSGINIGQSILTQAAMAGVQTFSSGIVTSAINGITYDHVNKFGYSTDTFTSGLKSTLINSLACFTSTLTSGILNDLSVGINVDKFEGFNRLNKQNTVTFNNLLGSLAGQGINYAFGEDFTINLLNLSLFTDNKFNSGLLELRLNSKNGLSMGFGTGGANLSMDNLARAFEGAYVWNLSNRVVRYTDNNDFKEQVALRAQYGYGDEKAKKQLFDILKKDTVFNFVEDEEFRAKTTIDDNGKRVINLANYKGGMSSEDQFLLAITLAHEAHRDGIKTDDNYLETRAATIAHTEMAIRMINDNINIVPDSNLYKDIYNYRKSAGDIDLFNKYIDSNYDSSADYWRLLKNGDLEYDGFASVYDSEGRLLLSYEKMGLKSNNSIEGSLLYLLNINPNDKENVAKVWQMMVDSGIQHTAGSNPENWFWTGGELRLVNKGSIRDYYHSFNITSANIGKTITTEQMLKLYQDTGASQNQVLTSMQRIYDTPINFFSYTNSGLSTNIASAMFDLALNEEDRQIININIDVIKKYETIGYDIRDMFDKPSEISSKFEEFLELDINKNGSFLCKFLERHTGGDAVSESGAAISVPDGFWKLVATSKNGTNNIATYVLYGSDIQMRIQHLDETEINRLSQAVNTVYGGSNSVMAYYPAFNNGTGTGAHVHIEITRNLPYGNRYERQFVNPETLAVGSRLDYEYARINASGDFVDRDGNVIKNGGYNYFNRNWIPKSLYKLGS